MVSVQQAISNHAAEALSSASTAGRWTIVLWGRWRSKDKSDTKETFTIITTAPRGSAMNDQGHSLERRRLLRWLGAAALVLPAALAACASSNASRQYGRTPSHISGSDHRDGYSEPINIIGIRYRF